LPYDPAVSLRVRALLAPPFAVLAFALSLGASLGLQPLLWRIEPDVAGLAVWLLLAAASMAVPAVAYALITGAFGRRPVAWVSDADEHRFSAPVSPRQGVLLVIWGGLAARLVPVERVPNQDRARIAQLCWVTTVFVIIAALLLIDVVLRSVTNRPDIALSPDALTLRRRVRRVEVRWEELVPGGPPRPAKRNPATIELLLPATAPVTAPALARPSRRLSLPAAGLHIDSAFLAYTIHWYVEHPDRRCRIGDPAELKEIQRGFAAADAGSP
jgi:hypothetical protein